MTQQNYQVTYLKQTKGGVFHIIKLWNSLPLNAGETKFLSVLKTKQAYDALIALIAELIALLVAINDGLHPNFSSEKNHLSFCLTEAG